MKVTFDSVHELSTDEVPRKDPKHYSNYIRLLKAKWPAKRPYTPRTQHPMEDKFKPDNENQTIDFYGWIYGVGSVWPEKEPGLVPPVSLRQRLSEEQTSIKQGISKDQWVRVELIDVGN